jgi:hypothetical protein
MDRDPAAQSTDRDVLAVLRRVERTALLWGLLFVLGWAVVEHSVDGFIVLTLAAAASMVSFRGLQRLVWQLGAREGGKSNRPTILFAVLRLSVVALLPLASLWLDSRQVLALALGFSVLPAALMSEALLQFLPFRSKPRDGS